MVTLSQKVEEILNKGADLAKEKRHAFLTPEHMLKAMLCDEEIKECIESAGGKITEMNTELDNYFNEIPTVSEAKPSEDSESLQALIKGAAQRRAGVYAGRKEHREDHGPGAVCPGADQPHDVL